MMENMDISTAAHIPQGTTIDRVYWAVPTSYTIGDEYETKRDALVAAIDQIESRPQTPYTDRRVTIDLRWKMSWEPTPGNPSSGMDTMVNRVVYATPEEAREALALIDKFADVVPR